jgi:DNA-directed RNA polymerase specialized sigma24 family protein
LFFKRKLFFIPSEFVHLLLDPHTLNLHRLKSLSEGSADFVELKFAYTVICTAMSLLSGRAQLIARQIQSKEQSMDEQDYTSSACDKEAFELSSEYDEYIYFLVQKNFPRWLFWEDEVNLEIDDLVQQTRIKFWMALQKRCIVHHKAYIGLMVRNGIVDIMRRRRNLLLSLDDYGEMRPGAMLVASGEGMRDPAYEYELKEIILEQTEHMMRIVSAILALPPRQRFAVIYQLKGLLDDIWPLAKALKAHNIDIEAFDWPEEKVDICNIRASLHYARKKLRILLRTTLDEKGTGL